MQFRPRALFALPFIVCCFALTLAPAKLGPSGMMAVHSAPMFAVTVSRAIAARPKPKARVAKRALVPKYLDTVTALRLTTNASHDVGIPLAFIQAIMRQESAGDINAHSSAGALGLMQMLPAVAREWGATHPYDIHENVYAATRYIAYLRTRYHGDVALTAAAYNAGPGTVDQYHGVPPYPETKRYVAAVVKSLHASLHPGHSADD